MNNEELYNLHSSPNVISHQIKECEMGGAYRRQKLSCKT
jgi:hypothetical protein